MLGQIVSFPENIYSTFNPSTQDCDLSGTGSLQIDVIKLRTEPQPSDEHPYFFFKGEEPEGRSRETGRDWRAAVPRQNAKEGWWLLKAVTQKRFSCWLQREVTLLTLSFQVSF